MLNENAAAIEAEIAWFNQVLDTRFRIHGGELDEDAMEAVAAPELPEDGAAYAQAVRSAGLSVDERLVLVLAALPHLRPQALDALLIANQATNRPFTEFGGVNAGTSGFFPSWETALFLLAGDKMARRLACLPLFDLSAPLMAHELLQGAGDECCPGAIPLCLGPGATARLMR